MTKFSIFLMLFANKSSGDEKEPLFIDDQIRKNQPFRFLEQAESFMLNLSNTSFILYPAFIIPFDNKKSHDKYCSIPVIQDAFYK